MCGLGKGSKLTDKVLAARREVLLALKVGEELVGVGIEAVHDTRRDEAVHLHGSVHANPQVPVRPGNVDGAGRRADGIYIAESREPTADRMVRSGYQNVHEHRTRQAPEQESLPTPHGR